MKDLRLSIKKVNGAFWKKKKSVDCSIVRLLYHQVFLLLPIFFLTILSLVLGYQYVFAKDIHRLTFINTPFIVEDQSYYPMLSTVLSSATKSQFSQRLPSSIENEISAKAAIVIDDDSKVILFAKNHTLRFSMASTTKLMTALTALDLFSMDDILTVYEESVEGIKVGFKKGEKLTLRDLLYAMLLPSGNDAALAISQNYSGGQAEFIEQMNEKARELFLFDTHFTDSIGLEDQGDYTTPLDLARLSSIVMNHPLLARIVATKHIVIRSLDGNSYSLSNLNKLLGEEGIDGVKTGFTHEAEGVLATSKIQNGHRLIIVVMKSKDRFLDTEKLLDLMSRHLIYFFIHSS